MKKMKIIMCGILLIPALLNPVLTFAHFSGHNSVDGREIRWTDHTRYDDARKWAIGRWNALLRVSILKDKWNTVNDLKWKDTDRRDVTWVGLYTYRSGSGREDYITFNVFYMRDLSTAKRRNVGTHELGHALGLDHSYAGQVMHRYVSSVVTPQDHDRKDYYALW